MIFFSKKQDKDKQTLNLKDQNDVLHTDPKIVANQINNHFVQKRMKLASKLPTPQ